jgi:hypothetical protein
MKANFHRGALEPVSKPPTTSGVITLVAASLSVHVMEFMENSSLQAEGSTPP